MRRSSRYTRFSVNDQTGTCTLARNGVVLATEFEGASIEAQYTLDDGRCIVCLSDDSPYDAGIHLYLLDSDDTLQDALEAGGFFTPGIYEAAATDATGFDFRFFRNDVVYRVTLLPQARFRFVLPAGWRYKHRLDRHYLTLSERSTVEAA